MKCNHTIHSRMHHYGWDNAIDPILTVTPGQTVEIETIDASGSQLTENSTDKDLLNLDFEKVNPVTGPIYVKGAQKGDVISIKFLEIL